MTNPYPHWYHKNPTDGEACCDMPHKPPYKEEECAQGMIKPYPDAKFKDRLLCLLGTEVVVSADARICCRESFCGTLCYVGCDFIIVNTCIQRRSVSLHIPIAMIRFIAPFKS